MTAAVFFAAHQTPDRWRRSRAGQRRARRREPARPAENVRSSASISARCTRPSPDPSSRSGQSRQPIYDGCMAQALPLPGIELFLAVTIAGSEATDVKAYLGRPSLALRSMTDRRLIEPRRKIRTLEIAVVGDAHQARSPPAVTRRGRKPRRGLRRSVMPDCKPTIRATASPRCSRGGAAE